MSARDELAVIIHDAECATGSDCREDPMTYPKLTFTIADAILAAGWTPPRVPDIIRDADDLTATDHYLALRDACGYPLVWTGTILKSPGDEFPATEGCYPMTVLT